MANDIFEERTAFNFYKSYYKTSLLLDAENRAEFLDCILHYQFTGELKEPKLPFASLAFNGQIHSLQKQVNGYIKGKSTYPTGNPTKGSGKVNNKGKGKEVQEEVQDKDKEENDTQPTAKQKSFKSLTEEEFKFSLIEFVDEFGKKTVREFFDYWSEKSPSGKMKFQLNKTWDSKKRLKTWKSNEFKFGSVKEVPKQTKVIPGPWNV